MCWTGGVEVCGGESWKVEGVVDRGNIGFKVLVVVERWKLDWTGLVTEMLPELVHLSQAAQRLLGLAQEPVQQRATQRGHTAHTLIHWPKSSLHLSIPSSFLTKRKDTPRVDCGFIVSQSAFLFFFFNLAVIATVPRAEYSQWFYLFSCYDILFILFSSQCFCLKSTLFHGFDEYIPPAHPP